MVEINDSILLIGGLSIFALLLFFIVLLLLSRRKVPDPYRRELVEDYAETRRRGRPKKVLSQQTLTKEQDDELPAINVKVPLDYTDAIPYNVVTEKKGKFSFAFWRNWWYDRRHPDSMALVHMELMNGFHMTMLVREKEEGFVYKGKKFLFDTEAKYYDLGAKLYVYDYHESFTLPVKRKIPVSDIRRGIEESDGAVNDIEYATNPKTLQNFAISKIAEGIMRGAALDEVFRFLKLVSIITLVVTIIHLLLFVFKSGILTSVSIAGVTG